MTAMRRLYLEGTMTHATTTNGTADTAFADDDVNARRARGIALIVGALLIVALVETETIPFYWFPTLTGLTYLAAAAAGRSCGTLWGRGSSSPASAWPPRSGCGTAGCPTASSSSPSR
jgi:hypothetical protein